MDRRLLALATLSLALAMVVAAPLRADDDGDGAKPPAAPESPAAPEAPAPEPDEDASPERLPANPLPAPTPDEPAPPPPASSSALLTTGAFEKLAEPIGELLTFTFEDGGRLVIDRDALGHAASDERRNAAADELAKLLGGRMNQKHAARQADRVRGMAAEEFLFDRIRYHAGGGGSRRGQMGGRRNLSFWGGLLRAQCEIAQGRVVVELEELAEPKRVIRMRSDGTDLFIRAEHPNGDAIEILQTGRRFIVVSILPEGVTAADFGSLARWWAARPEEASRVGPCLAQLGFRLPPWPNDLEVRVEVLHRLAPLAGDELEAARALIASLEDDDFEVREEATAEITERYRRLRTLVADALADPELGLESRGRLEQVVAAQPPEPAAARVIEAYGLTSDADYLIELLGDVPVAETRARVTARLRELTGVDGGDDPAAWRRLWDAKRAAEGGPTDGD